MASTYELIETTTLSSSASSVEFTSITQDYRDLVLVVSGSGKAVRITLNNNTSTIYNEVAMEGDNQSGAGSTTQTSQQQFVIGSPNWFTLQSHLVMQIMDYSATDKHKSCLTRTMVGQFTTIAVAGRAATTSAVTSIECKNGGDWTVGTVFSIYGIAA